MLHVVKSAVWLLLSILAHTRCRLPRNASSGSSSLAREDHVVLAAVQETRSGCLPTTPGATVSHSLISVMSGAKEGSLEHQVVGDPETVAGGSAPPRRSTSGGQRVSCPLPVLVAFLCSRKQPDMLLLEGIVIALHMAACIMTRWEVGTLFVLGLLERRGVFCHVVRLIDSILRLVSHFTAMTVAFLECRGR